MYGSYLEISGSLSPITHSGKNLLPYHGKHYGEANIVRC